MDLEKAYDRVNREALCQVLRIYDVGGKLLNGIKSVYIVSLSCVRVKGCESECFWKDSSGRYVFPWLFNGRSDELGENGVGRG